MFILLFWLSERLNLCLFALILDLLVNCITLFPFFLFLALVWFVCIGALGVPHNNKASAFFLIIV
jgi:hypothetical protein